MHQAIAQRHALASRLRLLRSDRFADDAAGLSRLIGLPPATWGNYERGVAMPAEVLLRLIEVTGVNPHWLSTGQGDRYGRCLGALDPPGVN